MWTVFINPFNSTGLIAINLSAFTLLVVLAWLLICTVHDHNLVLTAENNGDVSLML